MERASQQRLLLPLALAVVVLLLVLFVQTKRGRRRVVRSRANLQIARDRLVNDPVAFRADFRLSPDAFLDLVTHLQPSLTRVGFCELAPIDEVLITLHRLGSRANLRTTGEHFGLAKSTAFYAYWRVVRAINEVLTPRLLRWPEEAELADIRGGFEDIAGLRNVVGAIDCTHFEVVAPQMLNTDYLDRTRRHSTIAQCVVDASGRFIDANIGWPGSVHDARVLRNSALFARIKAGDIVIGPDVLLADSGYPLRSFMITPFDRRAQAIPSAEQKEFNVAHARTRGVVERAFGRLKARFRILRDAVEGYVGGVPEVALACLTLHNFAILRNDMEEFEDLPDVGQAPQLVHQQLPHDNGHALAAGVARRQAMLDAFLQNPA